MPKPAKSPAASTPKSSAVERALELIEADGWSARRACAETGASRSTVRYHLRRRGWTSGSAASPSSPGGAPAESFRKDESGVELSTTADGDADDALRRRGIEPDQYRITNVTVSEFGESSRALHVKAVRKSAMFNLPTGENWNPPVPVDHSKIADFADGGSVAFLADPHCPYENVNLSRAADRYLELYAPELVVLLGDLGEHGVLSRHRTHPRFSAMLDETNDAVAAWLYHKRMAAPEAQMVLIPGNHDYRILYYAQDYAERLGYRGGRPGRLPNETDNPEENLSIARQYRLAELGIEYVDEDWKLAKYAIAPELTARHGYLTGANTAKNYLEKHGRSQVHGHVHTGSVTYRTQHDPLTHRVVMSCGAMARSEPDGLGYDPEPNQTPGIGIGHVFEDGDFVLTFCPYINDNLLLPWGERISGKA